MKTNLNSTMRNKILRTFSILAFAVLSVISAKAQCTFYRDFDGDGFGNPALSIIQPCAPTPLGYVADNSDCDDAFTTYLDNDGDGYGVGSPIPCGTALFAGDCDDTPVTGLRYADNDNDGFGNPSAPFACGGVTNNLDCNDNLVLFQDADGDGFGTILVLVACVGVTNSDDCSDAQVLYQDNDADGFGSNIMVACGGVLNNLDCDDTQALFQDNDNDGFGVNILVPCGAPNTLDCDDNLVLYDDNDADGFGSDAKQPCFGVTNSTDCDDETNGETWADNDGDGWGAGPLVPCGVYNNFDCDDNFRSYEDNDGDGFGYPLGPVPCGGVFNSIDCDDFQQLYTDDDGDGFGFGIMIPCNGVANNLDCDDTPVSGLRYADNDADGFGDPASPVACGGVTNNLDCHISTSTGRRYADNDADGFGAGPFIPCGGSFNDYDCNDNNSAVNPNATELLCDGIDNDCNGVIDAGVPALNVDAGANKIVYKGYPDSACTRLQSTISGGVTPLTRVWSTAGNSNLGNGLFINVCPTTTRIYYLTVTDGNGCIKRDSARVCVIDVRCGTNNKSVRICHGTGSATNPYTTLCVGKTETNSHFLNHPGEQLGPCGMNKACNWPVQERLEAEGTQDEMEYIGAFPNPFSATTTIQFTLPENDFASVKVFDVAGREMENLFEGATEAGNIYTLTFDGGRFTNGIYFLMLNTRSGLMQTRKLMLNK